MRHLGRCATLAVFCIATSLFANDEEIDHLNRELSSVSVTARTTAARVLGEIGPAAKVAVPSLLKCLEEKDLGLRHETIVALGRINADAEHVVPALIPQLSDTASILRHCTVDALRRFGSDAQSAASELKKLLDDNELLIRVSAARAIVEIELGKGKDVSAATAVLISGLKAENHHISSDAIHGLALVGASAVTGIEEFVNHTSPHCACNACDALAAIGADAKASVPKLLTAAKATSTELRCHAIHAIGEIGAEAEKAVPVLVGLIGHKDGNLAFCAGRALVRIGKPAVPALIDAMSKKEHLPTIAHILAGIGPDASDAVPFLTKQITALDRPDACRESVLALAAIGPSAKEAAPALILAVGDKDYPFRPAAAFALGRIGAKDSIPVLKVALKSTENSVLQLASVWALLQLDPTNDEFVKLGVPILITSLDVDSPDIRREAALALGRMGSRAKEAVAALASELKDGTADTQRESLIALAEIGPDSAPAVDDIVQVLATGELALRPIACYALGRIGPPAKAGVPTLQRLLSSHDPHERTVAAWALVNIAPDRESIETAIPLLAYALKGAEKPSVRVEAAVTLGKIGKDSAIAKTALTLALKDPEDFVRKAADQALKSW